MDGGTKSNANYEGKNMAIAITQSWRINGHSHAPYWTNLSLSSFSHLIPQEEDKFSLIF